MCILLSLYIVCRRDVTPALSVTIFDYSIWTVSDAAMKTYEIRKSIYKTQKRSWRLWSCLFIGTNQLFVNLINILKDMAWDKLQRFSERAALYFDMAETVLTREITREKEGDLTQSYDKTPYTNKKNNTQTSPKTSITQRLRTDLGRSVWVTSHPTGVAKPDIKGTNLLTYRNLFITKSTFKTWQHEYNTMTSLR